MRIIILLLAFITCFSCRNSSEPVNNVNQAHSDPIPLFNSSEMQDSLMIFLESCDSVPTDVLEIREYLVDFDINARGDTILIFAAADEFVPSDEVHYAYDNDRRSEVVGGFMIEEKPILIRRVKDFPVKIMLSTEKLDMSLGVELDRKSSTDFVLDGPMIATYKVYQLIKCDSLHLLEHRYIGKQIFIDSTYDYPIFL